MRAGVGVRVSVRVRVSCLQQARGEPRSVLCAKDAHVRAEVLHLAVPLVVAEEAVVEVHVPMLVPRPRAEARDRRLDDHIHGGRPRLGANDEPVALLVHVRAERVHQPAARRARGQHDRRQRRVPQQVGQAPPSAQQRQHRQQLERLRPAQRTQLGVRLEQLAAQLDVVLGRRGQAAGPG